MNYPLLPVALRAVVAIAAFRILKPTTNDGEATVASAASDKLMAVSGPAPALAGQLVESHFAGIVPVEYGDTVAVGDLLTSDAIGRAVPATSGNRVIGRAAEKGSLGTIGSVIISPVGEGPGDAQAIYTHLTSKRILPLTLASCTLTDGTPLAKFADGASTTPGLVVDDSEAPGTRWNNHATPAAFATSLAMPSDLNDTADVTLRILASKTGATLADATKFTVGVFVQTLAALRDASADAGGDSGAMVGDAASKTVQELSLTIAAAAVPAVPCIIALTIKPKAGTLGTDDVTIHAAWLEYTPKILT